VIREQLMAMLTAALYAVFLYNLVFSGGLGATEIIRAAKKNGGMLTFSLLISVFSALTAAICRLLTVWIPKLETVEFQWHVLLYGSVLLVLYLIVCTTLSLVRFKAQAYLLKYMGMAVLNTLVMAVPLLSFQLGYNLPRTIAMGVGAGLAFAGASLLINSGMHLLQQNKAIPVMFTGVPATLIYTALLALAFTGFTGSSLFGVGGEA
jgi:Na+-translocating ferredoxin:NAD+ oxidoreductase RnfA subunit